MPRRARVVVPDMPHHITQRGNYKQDVFESNHDRTKYLSIIEKYQRRYNLKILSYCLMTNHVHFVAIPEKVNSMSLTFRDTHMVYSHYLNKKKGVAGHLWKGRFYSCVMDEFHLLAGVRYIERNPVRAGLVKKPWEWEWSSAAYHCGKSHKSCIKLKNLLELVDMNKDEWTSYIEHDDDPIFIEKIKKSTFSGRPFARSGVLKKWENKLGMRLRAYPRGRPQK